MNRESNFEKEVLRPKNQQDQQIQMQKCESFSREVFTKVVKTFIKDKLQPKISRIVNAYMSQLKVIQSISKMQLEKLMEVMNSNIMNEIW